MKATTLIFIVLAALGLWFLYHYMNRKSKNAEIYPGPGGINTAPTGTTVIDGKIVPVNQTTAPVNTINPADLIIRGNQCYETVQSQVDAYNSLPKISMYNALRDALKADIMAKCPIAVNYLK